MHMYNVPYNLILDDSQTWRKKFLIISCVGLMNTNFHCPNPWSLQYLDPEGQLTTSPSGQKEGRDTLLPPLEYTTEVDLGLVSESWLDKADARQHPPVGGMLIDR